MVSSDPPQWAACRFPLQMRPHVGTVCRLLSMHMSACNKNQLCSTVAAWALLGDIANRRGQRERVFRDHTNLLAQDGYWLISWFRLPRTFCLLCAELVPCYRSRSLLLSGQVVTTLVAGAFRGSWLTDRVFNPELRHVSLMAKSDDARIYIKFPTLRLKLWAEVQI